MTIRTSKTALLLVIIALSVQNFLFSQITGKISAEVQKQIAPALSLCKHLHANPELSFQEFETAKRMAAELRRAGLEVTENFAGNNVVGVYRNGKGPVVFLRTDMDALPIEEKTNLDFASKQTAIDASGQSVPVMHACGHDIHMAVWSGTIHALVALRKEWNGTLLVIAQQAEEVSGGSGEVIKAGLFEKFPTPDFGLAYHINPELEAGKIGVVGGPVFAGVETVEITVFGKGGHGAYPEKCIDPIIIASRIVTNLQTIVSREISPLEPVVITVGSIHGGSRPNIIPDEVKMELTLRYYSQSALEQVISGIRRICNSAAQMAGMPDDHLPEIKLSNSPTPPVVNDAWLANSIRTFASSVLGDKNVISIPPSMVGEDFGKYGLTPEKVPICLMWLGSRNSQHLREMEARGERPAPLHSPYLMPDYPKTIETGITAMVAGVIGLMKK